MYIYNYVCIYIYIYIHNCPLLLLLLLNLFSLARLCATPRTAIHQALLSIKDSPGKTTGVGCYFLLLIVHYGKTITKMTRDYIYIFPGGSVIKIQSANAGDTGYEGSIPGSGRSPVRGNGNLLQYSCLKNPMDEEPGL